MCILFMRPFTVAVFKNSSIKVILYLPDTLLFLWLQCKGFDNDYRPAFIHKLNRYSCVIDNISTYRAYSAQTDRYRNANDCTTNTKAKGQWLYIAYRFASIKNRLIYKLRLNDFLKKKSTMNLASNFLTPILRWYCGLFLLCSEKCQDGLIHLI